MGALDGSRMAAEFRDMNAILVGDANIIDARPALARHFARGGRQTVADAQGFANSAEADPDMLRLSMWPGELDPGAGTGISLDPRESSGATQTASDFAAALHHLTGTT